MGNRANVKISDHKWDSVVYLYTHWGQTDLPATVQRVLQRHERWGDASYLARMIFSAMVRDDIDGELGFGISSAIGDGGGSVIEIDCVNQRIRYTAENPDGTPRAESDWVSIGNFVKHPDPDWPEFCWA